MAGETGMARCAARAEVRALLAVASHQPSQLRGHDGTTAKARSASDFIDLLRSSIQADSRRENENADTRAGLATSETTAWLDRPSASENRTWRPRARKRRSHS